MGTLVKVTWWSTEVQGAKDLVLPFANLPIGSFLPQRTWNLRAELLAGGWGPEVGGEKRHRMLDVLQDIDIQFSFSFGESLVFSSHMHPPRGGVLSADVPHTRGGGGHHRTLEAIRLCWIAVRLWPFPI